MGSGVSSTKSSGSSSGSSYLDVFSKDSAVSNALGSSWTKEEQVQNDKAVQLYERLSEFAYNHYFSGVTVRQGRKGLDPQAPLWIEPSPEFYTPELTAAMNQSSANPYLASSMGSSSSSSSSSKGSSSPGKMSVDREIKAILKGTNIVDPNHLYNAERERYLKAIPSGVLLKSDGVIKVLFTLSNTEYEFQSTDVDKYFNTILQGKKALRAPQPPLVKVLPVNYLFPAVSITDEEIKRSKFRAILLSWSNRLPLPLGLIHQIEVQYSMVNSAHAVVIKFQKLRDEHYETTDNFKSDSVSASTIHDSINEKTIAACKAEFFSQGDDIEEQQKIDGSSSGTSSSSSNSPSNKGGSNSSSTSLWKPWQSLVSKALEYPDFGSFTSELGVPGGIYSYRIRYRCAANWSSYSPRSTPVAIPPAPPDSPASVRVNFVTAVATLISWAPPTTTGGCKVKEYILYCRAVEASPSKKGGVGGLLDDDEEDMAITATSHFTTEFQVVYQGLETKYLVTGLSPETAYGFTVTTVTFAGESKKYEPNIHILTSPLVAFRHLRALLRGKGGAGGGRRKKGGKPTEENHNILDIINGIDSQTDASSDILGIGFSNNTHLAKEQFEFAMSCRLAWRVCYDVSSRSQFYFNIITSVRTRDMPEALVVSSAAATSTTNGSNYGNSSSSTSSSNGDGRRRGSSNNNYNNSNSNSNSNNNNNSDALLLVSTSEEGFDQQFRKKRFQLYTRLRDHLQSLQKSSNRMHRFNLDKTTPIKGKKGGIKGPDQGPSSPLSRMQAAASSSSEEENYYSSENMFSEPPRLAFDEDIFLDNDNENENGGSINDGGVDNNGSRTGSNGGGGGEGSSSRVTTEDGDINRSREGVVIVKLHRSRLLFDAFHCFMRLSWSDITRKLKVVFEGESGVDSGGLGREAFLLISRQISQFSGKSLRSWLVSLENNVNTNSSSSSGGISRSGGGSTSKISSSSFSGIKAVKDEGMGAYFISSDYIGPGPNASASSTSANSKSQTKASSTLTAVSAAAAITPSFVDKDENHLSSASIKALDDMNVTKTSFLFFVGVFMGKALLDGQIIDLRWSYIIYQHIIGGLTQSTVVSHVDNISYKVFDINWPICIADLDLLLSHLMSVDSQLATSLLWMVENDITGVIEETFSVLVSSEAIDLCPNGCNIPVTNANKLHYARLVCTWRTQYSIQESLQALLEGFHGLVPLDIMASEGITPSELVLILNGKVTIDVHEVRAYCIYQASGSVAFNETRKTEVAFNEDHFLSRWFFKILEEVPTRLQKAIIKFITGTACVPNDGYDPPFNITYGASAMIDDSLPRSHTCFHQIVLPHYTSYAKMKERIIFAVENTAGFELM